MTVISRYSIGSPVGSSTSVVSHFFLNKLGPVYTPPVLSLFLKCGVSSKLDSLFSEPCMSVNRRKRPSAQKLSFWVWC